MRHRSLTGAELLDVGLVGFLSAHFEKPRPDALVELWQEESQDRARQLRLAKSTRGYDVKCSHCNVSLSAENDSASATIM